MSSKPVCSDRVNRVAAGLDNISAGTGDHDAGPFRDPDQIRRLHQCFRRDVDLAENLSNKKTLNANELKQAFAAHLRIYKFFCMQARELHVASIDTSTILMDLFVKERLITPADVENLRSTLRLIVAWSKISIYDENF